VKISVTKNISTNAVFTALVILIVQTVAHAIMSLANHTARMKMSPIPNVSTKIWTSKKFAEILVQINHTTASKSVSSTRPSVKILTHAQTAVGKIWSNATWDAHVMRIALMVARALSGVNIQQRPLRLPRRQLPLQQLPQQLRLRLHLRARLPSRLQRPRQQRQRLQQLLQRRLPQPQQQHQFKLLLLEILLIR